MRRIGTSAFLLALCLLMVRESRAQFVPQSQKVYEQTLQSTVLVVLKYSDSLNSRIRAAFQKHWTLTPYQFVSGSFQDSMNRVKAGSGYSVFEGTLVKTINVQENEIGQRKERGTFGNWWSYFLVPFDKKGKPDAELVTAWSPVNMFYYEWSDETQFEHTSYRIEYIVRQMHDVLQFVKDHPKGDTREFKSWVNAKAARLKDRTLLIPEELLGKYDIWKVMRQQMEAGVGKVYTSRKAIMMAMVETSDLADYGGKYRVLPYAEIDRLGRSGEAKDYALFAPLVADQKYIFAYDLASKELIYMDQALMSNQVNKKDIKQLGRQAGF